MTKKAIRMGSVLWLHCEGRTYTLDTQEKKTGRSNSAKAAHSDGIIRSPMPGKILKVNYRKGDKVKSGDTVCVVEAMKMEYTIKAPFDGHITEIFKSSDAPVVLDEKIAEIERK